MAILSCLIIYTKSYRMEQYKALVKHPKQAFSNMFRLNKPHLQVAAGSLEAIFTPANKKQEILTMIKNHQPVKSLTKDQRAYFNRVIRVDQAGELGANYIYAGQYYILSNKYPHLKDVLQHMWDQEIHHHSTFNKLQLKHGVRPSFITPIWTVGAFAMGAGTALISPQAAMACTEAVETVIGGHYNDQLRVLNKFFKDKELLEGEGNYEINEIIETIKQFRDDELEHLDTAIKYDSKKAVPYILLTEGIKTICRVAIFAAERI